MGSFSKDELIRLERNHNYFMGEGVGAPLAKIKPKPDDCYKQEEGDD